jgi:hypothetical protein
MPERLVFDETEGKLYHQKITDAAPAIERAKWLKDVPASRLPVPDSRLVASVPLHMVALWLQEAGVSWDDREAAQEVLKRKLLSGEAAAFRVDERSW